ncbi:hypothetical protein AMJ74_02965 [candidate division WOR_3 bacterium SM1_77]|uniref:Aspartokinase n=1 Tax=candidate division WOR_3 bacterium SM1_77 TaxID=1703778 RepID=A0A0S8K173_UNCW3|nr:MAG: hypothetical protein AMJ74_02965 [candidate division WOR_3 bacterium SM1_77]
MKKLAVIKFGGTCLAQQEDRRKVAEHCVRLLDEYQRLVIVVSAMGRSGDSYATDTLLGLVSSPTPREKDSLMACGEVISAVVLAGELRQAGISARALTGWEAGIATDGVACNSNIEFINREPLMKLLDEYQCAVVAGFQGKGPDGVVTTLGRGGSDTTAIALAAALEADEAILFKNLESVFTADPERVPEAQKIERISAEDLRQLAWQGANVVHPRAAEIALGAELEIQVRSYSDGHIVTKIEPYVVKSGRYISGVVAGPDVYQFTTEGRTNDTPSEFFAWVFSMVADAGISMDMFSVFGKKAVFTVPAPYKKQVQELLGKTGISFTCTGPCTKISIVGAGMHDMKGVMARFSKTLANAGINMLQSVDSHATISGLVPLEQRDIALRELHKEFIEK